MQKHPEGPNQKAESIGWEFAKACRTQVLHGIVITFRPVRGQSYTRSSAVGTHPTTGEPVEICTWYRPAPDDRVVAWVSVDGVPRPLNSSWEDFASMVGDISDYAQEQIFGMIQDLVAINVEATKVLVERSMAALQAAHAEAERVRDTQMSETFQVWKSWPDNTIPEVLSAERAKVFTLLNYMAATYNAQGPEMKD